ncbi:MULTISPECIES: LGFP repeat-containing protein, partial [unclassified Blastococcus]
LGYPTGDDQPTADRRGYMTPFQGGEIHWSAQTGAQVVRGAILDTWKRAGGSGGYLGFPTTSDAPAGRGGYVVEFQSGSLYWGPSTGTKVVRGAILAAYKAAGGPAALGYPTGDDQPTADRRGYMTPFQGGEIHWSAQTGAQVVRGAILYTWKQAGGTGGYLGFPTTSDAPAPGGQGYQTSFQGGTIYWSATTQARVLRTELNAAYLAQGGTTGPLGYPISDTVVVGAQQRAEFQNGVLTAP